MRRVAAAVAAGFRVESIGARRSPRRNLVRAAGSGPEAATTASADHERSHRSREKGLGACVDKGQSLESVTAIRLSWLSVARLTGAR